MKIPISQLQQYKVQPLILDQELTLESEALERFEGLYLQITPVVVKGKLQVQKNSDIILNLVISGVITLPSSRSGLPVKDKFNIKIDEIYIQDAKEFERFSENDSVFLIETDTLDFDQIIADNIFSEIPLYVLTNEEKNNPDLPKGEGWKLISDKNNSINDENNDHQKLGDFFPDDL